MSVFRRIANTSAVLTGCFLGILFGYAIGPLFGGTWDMVVAVVLTVPVVLFTVVWIVADQIWVHRLLEDGDSNG